MTPELDIAAAVLELVRTAAGNSAEAEVTVNRQALALTRFANSFIHQNVADDTISVRLRLHSDGRTATGSTTLTAADGLRGLVERTVAASRLCPPDPAWPGLTPPAPSVATAGYDEATANAGPDERAERVNSFVDAAGGLETAGYCRTIRWIGAFANSAGQTATGQTSEAAMDGIARLDGSDGVARLATTRLADIAGEVLGSRAAAKARAGTGPVELPPGQYEVVLESTAVRDLLDNLAFYGFNGKALVERRSFVELGEQQFDPSVTLVDAGPGPDSPGAPYDVEGTPRRRLTVVDAGVTRAVAHDRRTAARAGVQSTGHALPGAATLGPIPAALSLLPGKPSVPNYPPTSPEASAWSNDTVTEVDGPVADSTVADLVTGVERGILVTDFWYTRVLDPKTLVLTGLTRNGVWLIEHGQVTTPVRNFRFTQSYPQALASGAVRGVGTHATPMPGVWATSWVSAPALHLASWNFTGNASG